MQSELKMRKLSFLSENISVYFTKRFLHHLYSWLKLFGEAKKNEIFNPQAKSFCFRIKNLEQNISIEIFILGMISIN
jgi:hypothetical protein